MGANIPLPALNIQVPQQTDFLSQVQKVQALKAMMQQQQYEQEMHPLQLEQQRIENQKLQQQQQDDAILGNLWTQSHGDLEKMKTALPDSGVSQRGAVDFQQKVAVYQDKVNTMDESHFKAITEGNALLGPMAQSVLDAPPEDQPMLYQLKRNQIMRDPQLARYAQNIPAQYDPNALTQFIAGAKTFEQLGKDRTTAAEHGPLTPDQISQNNTNFATRVQRADPSMDTSQFQLPAGATVDDYKRKEEQIKALEQNMGPAADTKYRALQQQAAQGVPVNAQDAAWAQGYEKQKLLSSQFQVQNRVEPGAYLPVNDDSGATTGWVDPKSNRFISASSIPGLNAPNGVIPPKPTQSMRNVGAQAALVHEQTPMMLEELDDLKDQLGPLAGQWDAFMQGKVGLDNPKFAALRTDLLMYSSAVALMHARGRLPENLRKEFDDTINAPRQSAANLKAIISKIDDWTVKNMNTMGAPPPGSVNTATGGGGGGGNAAPRRQVGDKVQLKNGKTVTVTAVHPDGSWDAQ